MCQIIFVSLVASILMCGLEAASIAQDESRKLVTKEDGLEVPQLRRDRRSQEEIQQQMVHLLQGGQEDIQKLLETEQKEQMVFQQQQFVVSDQPELQEYVQKQEGNQIQNIQQVILQHQGAMQKQQQRLQQDQLSELVNHS